MNITASVLLLSSFLILIFMGVHICYAMLMSAVITMTYLKLSLNLLISTMIDGMDGFTFLAVPFFMLAGEVMSQGGISSRLISFSKALVGWMRGGLAHVNIIASTFFRFCFGGYGISWLYFDSNDGRRRL